MKTIDDAAREWIQTQYPEESRLVGGIKHPERERDFATGALWALEEVERLALLQSTSISKGLDYTCESDVLNIGELKEIIQKIKGNEK